MNEAIIGAIVGGILTGVPTTIIAWLNLREARKRQIIESSVQYGLAEWQQFNAIAQDQFNRGKKVSIPPAATCYLGGYLLMKKLEECKSDEEIKKAVLEATKLSHSIYDTLKERQQNQAG